MGDVAARDEYHFAKMSIVGEELLYSAFGHVERARASFVTAGVSQSEVVHFLENPLPVSFIYVPHISTATFIGSLAGRKRSFCQAKFNEVVYLRLPPGQGALSGKVVTLGRSLYSLKQASRAGHSLLL